MLITDMPARRKFTDEIYNELCEAFELYIHDYADPIIAGFIISDVARKYHCTDDDLTNGTYPKLKDLARVALKKQEYYLQREGLVGQGTAMAIFRLKQPYHGFKDRTDTNITTDNEHVTFLNTLPRVQKPGGKDKQGKGKR